MYNFNTSDAVVSVVKYQDDKYTGLQRLDQARLNAPDEEKSYLNSLVTYIYGTQFEKNFPILTQTQGMGNKSNKTAVDSLTGTYYNHFYGKPKTTSVVGKTSHKTDEIIGLNKKPVFLYMKDRFFMKGQEIITGGFNGSHLRIYDNPVNEGSLWKYECYNMKLNKQVPYSHVKPGAVWGASVVSVSLEHSRGTENRGQSTFRTRNQIKVLRKSMNLAGNVENKMMNFKIKLNGRIHDTYVSWERHMTELQFNAEREMDLILSPYNADENGAIDLMDIDSGKAVPSGKGLWDQIPASNELSYSLLSERRFSSWIDDMISISGMAGTMGQETIDIIGGEGLMTEIDNALKRSTSGLTYSTDSDKFVRSTPGNDGGLQAGWYFTSYRHRSGKVFRFTTHPIFDHGALADSSERYPLNPSRPSTSYSGMILNFGQITMDSKERSSGMGGNIEYVYEKGREYIEGTVKGMSQINGEQGGNIASDVDGSAWHMMASQSIHMHNPMGAGKISNIIS